MDEIFNRQAKSIAHDPAANEISMRIMETYIFPLHFATPLRSQSHYGRTCFIDLGPVNTNYERGAAVPNEASQGARSEVW